MTMTVYTYGRSLSIRVALAFEIILLATRLEKVEAAALLHGKHRVVRVAFRLS